MQSLLDWQCNWAFPENPGHVGCAVMTSCNYDPILDETYATHYCYEWEGYFCPQVFQPECQG